MRNKQGLLYVLSGPSGCGKGTVVRELLDRNENIFLSVSATTRSPRSGEVHGQHYYFLSKEQFEEQIAADGMLEHANSVSYTHLIEIFMKAIYPNYRDNPRVDILLHNTDFGVGK